MNWNDYEAVWKRQELPVGKAADPDAVRHTFEGKRRKLARTLFVRDTLESAAGLLVSSVFGYVWWHMGREGWPIAFAIMLILGVTVFFVQERIRTHRHHVGPDASLLTKLEAEIAELRHQRHLLLRLWWWYLAPCAGAILIFGFAVVRLLIAKAPPGFFSALWKHPATLAWMSLYLAVILPGCFWGAWLMNRKVVRIRIEPRIAELEKLHRDLLSPV